MQKVDLQTSLLKNQNQLVYPGSNQVSANAVKGEKASQIEPSQQRISLIELGQYRVKNHCNYDLASVGTRDYSIFQIEIVDEQLHGYYRGRFILEVWNRAGERLFQKVLQEELTQWKVLNNVFVFKNATEPQLIYVLFLSERKMTTIKHPYEDFKEVDLMFYENYLIVAQNHSIRFVQINPSDVTTTISQYQNGELNPVLLSKEFSGLLQNERITGAVYNHLKNELVFVCANDTFQLSYYKLSINKGNEKRQITLAKYEPVVKSFTKVERKQLPIVPSDIEQVHLISSNQVPILLVLRKNQHIDVVFNFLETMFVEQRMNVKKILPSFGDNITFRFHDDSIAYAPSFDRFDERKYLSDSEYYKEQFLPPVGSVQHDLHNALHFYNDAVVINQSLFLVRDNAIFIVNTFTRKIVATHFPSTGYQGSRVLSLHKLRQQNEDEQGFKVTTFKVVAVHQNGALQVFVPSDINLMNDWQRNEITNTPMSSQRDPVHASFQNQNASNYIYIVTVNNQNNTQRVYQMMFNTQIIEFSNLKLQKGDLVFSVNSQSRQRELLGIVDVKYLAIYRNDKGNLIKLYQINHTRYEIRDNINANSVFYFQRDYAIIITKQLVYKINITTNVIDNAKLAAPVALGGSAFIDAQCFYFLAGHQDAHSLLSCADTSMIEAAFTDSSKGETQSAIIDKDDKKAGKLMHPTFDFGASLIKRMDFDEFNSVMNLQSAKLEIIQIPLYHRNTVHFIGMAERSFYLCFKRHGDVLFALDKHNYMNKWSTATGELLARTPVQQDYRAFDVDRELYDRDWFPHTLLHRNDLDSSNVSNSSQTHSTRTYKLVEIDERGTVVEKMSFSHAAHKNQKQHLYFNKSLTKMIELIIGSGPEGPKATYNEYILDQKAWVFVRSLNSRDNIVANFVEWHTKTLYPYSINPQSFAPLDAGHLNLNQADDTYKMVKGGEKVKILNTVDGIEMLVDVRTGEIDNYMALQYSFANTKTSFYDKQCGHFFIQEITSRLQNFYEHVRRQIFLNDHHDKKSSALSLQSLDVSARDYKYKYVIEQSFTHMDAMFFRQYFSDQKHTNALKILKKMSGDHIQRLVHNIFPRSDNIFGTPVSEGNTFLHFLAKFNLGFECVDLIGKLAKKDGFVVPFLINSAKETPLDLTVHRRDHKQTDSLIKLLQKAPMDHHSRLIAHLVPKLVSEMNLPHLEKYFDRRRFQTGVCKSINLMKIKIDSDQEMRSIPTSLINNKRDEVECSLTHKKCNEQTVSLEVFDLPMTEDLHTKKVVDGPVRGINEYEIKLIKSFASTDNFDVFQQKTVRAFIDFMWPIAKYRIIKNVFLPYIAFIFYYLLYLVVIKKLTLVSQTDPDFFEFTSGFFNLYDIMFKIILFLGCSYFLFQDFQQMTSLASNQIVLWSYANVVPLVIMILVILGETFFTNRDSSQGFQKTFYSITAFLIWIRVIHLLKCFTHTSYLLRMASEIIFRIRWLIAFIVISLFSFGFTFFFVDDGKDISIESPEDGIKQMFFVLLGRYDVASFENTYQSILLVIVTFFNAFFIFTLLVSLSVVSFSKGDQGGVWSNEAYQDKASLMGLYAYLLEEQTIRLPNKSYLLITTVTEGRKRARKGLDGSMSQIGGGAAHNPQIVNAKMMKSIDRRLTALSSRVDRALKEIGDKAGAPAGGN